MPCGAAGSACLRGVPFGFAQGRLSTAHLLQLREADAQLRMTVNAHSSFR
jgi:hypothetical protein